MNRPTRTALFFIWIACVTSSYASDQHRDLDTVGVSFFKQRSQGSNTARRDMGITEYLYLFDTCRLNGAFSIIPEYTRSFAEDEIAKFLFFNGKVTMQFAGSGEPGTDVAPINFLLNEDFKGTIKANPRVENGLVDFNLYLGLDSWLQGLYVQAHAPICWTKWDINFEQETESVGTVIDANQLGNTVAEAAPNTSIIEAWRGTATFNDVTQPMNFAKVDCAQTEFKVADVEVVAGYTAISCSDSHLSFNLRAMVPTGNKSKGVFFFEPIAGNAHHIEFGGGINGHFTIWHCQPDKKVVAYMEGNIFHMFKNRQTRTFDLKVNGKGSRYLLFKKFNEDSTYAGEIVQGPNILTREADIHIGVHGDATLLLEYRNNNLVADLGYNLWGRTSEEIDNIEPVAERTYGVKGNTSTEQMQPSTRDTTASLTKITGVNGNTFDPLPVLISTQNLDPASAASPGAFTHKLFFYVGYNAHNKPLKPFFGAGLEAEFSGRDNNALRQLGILLKTGCAF